MGVMGTKSGIALLDMFPFFSLLISLHLTVDSRWTHEEVEVALIA